MRKVLFFLLLLSTTLTAMPQTFTGGGGAIPDAGAQTCFPITVSGVGNINALYGLASVCLTINHPFDADLEIILKAPDGTPVQLSISNGGNGSNFTGTCFTAAATTPISNGTAPFTGNYMPQGYMGNVNNGQNADGTWLLCIQDVVPNDVGTLENWALSFSNTPAAPPASCSGNPAAGNTWASATPICNFNGFCGSTSASAYTTNTWPELSNAFCGVIDNNAFVSFIAAAPSASFNVWVTNSLKALGIQMFFFSNNTGAGLVTSHGCYTQIFPSSSGPTLVTATGLIPGNKYYLMIDGRDGDICNYTISAATGVNFLSVTPMQADICPGQAVELQASGGNGIYNWAPAEGLNKTTGNKVIVTPAETTVYTVTSGGNSGCPLSAAIGIIVHDKPSLGEDKTLGICPGGSFNLNELFNTASLNTLWTSSGITVTNPSAINTTGQYELVGTNEFGCADTAALLLTSTSKPNLGEDKTQPLCKSLTTDLTTLYNTTGLTTQWTFGGVPVTAPEAIFFPGKFQLVASAGSNCIDTVLVTVVEYPLPNLGSDKTLSICPGTSIDLQGLYTTTGLSASWLLNNMPLTTPTHVTDSGTYQLIVQNTGGCTDSAEVTVTVKPDFSIGTDTTINICEGTSINISQLFSTGGYTTEWRKDGIVITAPVAESATAQYQLVALNGLSCTDTVWINLVVRNNPKIGNDKTEQVCTGSAVNLTQQFNTPGMTQTWYKDGLPVINPFSIVDAPGTYQMVAKNIYGCSDTAAFTIIPAFKPKLGPDKTITICNEVPYNLNSTYSFAGLTASWSISGTPVTNANAITEAGVYRVIATGGIGCSDTAFVTVNKVAALHLGADKTKFICEGSTVNLANEFATANLQTFWTKEDIPVADAGSVDTPGTYQLIATDGGTCNDTALLILTVNPKPFAGKDTTVAFCLNDSINLPGIYPATGLLQNWTMGGLAVTKPSAVNSSGLYRRIVIEPVSACRDTAFVTLQALQTPDLGPDKNLTFCSGFTADLNSIFNNTGFDNYWTKSGVAVANLSAITVPGLYKLVSVSAAGCRDSARVTLNFGGKLNLGADKQLSICPGTTADLTKVFSTGTLNSNWTLNGTPVLNPAAVASSGNYQLIADNAVGCQDTAVVTVSYATKPDLGDDQQVLLCEGKSVNVASLFNFAGLFTKWEKDGNPIAAPGTASTAATYTLVVANTKGCTDTANAIITVNSRPNLGSDRIKTICPWDVININDEFTLDELTALWTLNGKTVAAPAAVDKPGNYRVIASDANGCTDTASLALIPGSKPSLGPDQARGVCPGTTRNINALYPTHLVNNWYFNDEPVTNPTRVSEPGFYTLIVANNNGCTDTAIVRLYNFVKPDLGNDKNISICPGSSVGLNAQYNLAGLASTWTKEDNTPVTNPNAATEAGLYRVIVREATGCADTAFVQITVKNKPALGIDKKESTCPGVAFDLTALYNTGTLNTAWTQAAVNITQPNAVTQHGIYQLVATNTEACSDTALVILTHHPKPSLGTDKNIAICTGETASLNTLFNTTGLTANWQLNNSMVTNNNSVSTPGEYILTATNSFNCSDTASVQLSVKNITYSTSFDTICKIQTPYSWNGNSYHATGNYQTVLTNAAGCDSIATLHLMVYDSSSSVTTVTICNSELPYVWNNNSYTNAGVYQTILVNANGCDSIATLHLHVNNSSSSITEISICENDLPYTWNDSSFNTGGTYKIILQNILGCDSTAFLKLIVKQESHSHSAVTVCANQLPYQWNGNNYNAAGSYDVLLKNIAGCDSIATLTLTVNDTSYSNSNITICANQLPYQWNGNNYNAAGTYEVGLKNIAGCDSIATLTLTVNDTSYSNSNITICANQLPYQWNNNNYNAAGTYEVWLKNIAGCDSVATLTIS
ncbi:MAG TPA: proprotein convertase P-domain-containing protein, partial [Ferruginibacter sp.]|nr:proprotein convertase P-domain-containing protein [Ferruginibacter sp.]